MSDSYEKEYLNADLVKLKEKFGDKRGFIQPLCDLNMKSASLLYTKETEILVMSKNPRDQKTYEEDTVRIDFMNDQRRF